jgi:hypothetical protein
MITTITDEFLMIKRKRSLSIDMNNEQTSQPHKNREHFSLHCRLHLFDALCYVKEKLLRNNKALVYIFIRRKKEGERDKSEHGKRRA